MTDTTTETTVDIAAIATLVAADIGVRFGLQVQPEPTQVQVHRDTHVAKLAIEQTLGVFAMVVESATVSIQAGPVPDGTIHVRASLDWEHLHGGRNGSNIGTWWTRDGEIVQFRAG